MLQKSDKDPCAICYLWGVSAKSSFCVACSSWVLKRCNVISSTLKPDPIFKGKRCNGLARPVDNQWQRSQREGRRLRWCHPSVTLGTDYPRVAAVNSLPSQDAVSHGANSMSPCQVPILTSQSFPITSRGRPYISMQAEPESQPHLICIICNATTGL